MSGYIGNRTGVVTVTSPELDSKYVSATGDSPTFGTVTASDITLATGAGSLLTFQDSTGTNGYKLRANVSASLDYGFLIEDLAGGDLLKVESNGTVTATSYEGDGSALTGIGSTTYGDVGTYVFARKTVYNSTIVAGSTYAGSLLKPHGVFTLESGSGSQTGSASGSTLSGTWRAMGTRAASPYTTYFPASIFVRIS